MSQEMGRIQHQAFVGPIDVEDLQEGDRACPICLMEYEMENCDENENTHNFQLYDCMKDNRQPVKLTCGHIFGTTCIEKWLSKHDTCCMCRATVKGDNRKPAPIPQEQLSAITTFDEARHLMYYEDIAWNEEYHDDIREVIQLRCFGVVDMLEQQFELLKEIDLRLGTQAANTSRPIAKWMRRDWLIFSQNAWAVLDLIVAHNEYTFSQGELPSSEMPPLMRSVLEMLFTNAERLLL
jgi:hypothetical protein